MKFKFLTILVALCFFSNLAFCEQQEEASDPFADETVKISSSSEKSKDEKEDETTATVNILDKETADEAKVKTDGFPKEGVIEVIGGLRLREWPWGPVVGEYPNGTAVKVLGESGEFYLVEINGQQGYMHKSYVSTPDAAASKVEPYYPGNTRAGGSLGKDEGIKASNDGSEGKRPTTTGSEGTSGQTGGMTTGGNGRVVLNVPQKCQGGTNTPHPWSACGPTSLAMALGYYTGKNVDSLATDLWYKCGATGAAGTSHQGMVNGAKAYGYNNAHWCYSVTQSWVREQIKAGKPVIANVAHHYVCIKGIDDNGNVIINDPGKWAVEFTYSWNDFCAWWTGGGCTRAAMVLE